MSGALLVAGTTSDAGKSMVVAGLCRLLSRKGIRVAPFKAQNMSNNSAVTVEGGEIGRAQAMQAAAAGLEPHTRFNPVLLKPGSDRTSQLVVRGQVAGTVAAGDYFTHRKHLAAVVAEELAALRTEFDAVICEGAGSPAEINLRATDLANMGLARAAGLPVLIVGDIDRGGVLAHFFGTVAVLEPADQALIAGFLVNKFRGDPALLAPGLDRLAELIDLHERLGGTVVYVTHDQIEAMTMADRVAIMANGALHQVGTPDDVYDRPANTFVAGFIGTPPMNLMDGVATSDGVEVAGAKLDATHQLAVGAPVVVGIRPEHLVLSDDGLAMEVKAVEWLGYESLITADLVDVGAAQRSARGDGDTNEDSGTIGTASLVGDAVVDANDPEQVGATRRRVILRANGRVDARNGKIIRATPQAGAVQLFDRLRGRLSEG